MKEVVLQRIQEDGTLLRAIFLPEQGMNLISLRFGDIELIDQSTKKLFNERLSGLGPLIGPHFYHRKHPAPVIDDTLFSHIAALRAKGEEEFFSHGIGRYVAWNWSASDLSIEATISGMDSHRGVTLAALEGFDFEMIYKAHLTKDGMEISMSVESKEAPTICGLHYYYALDPGKSVVKMDVDDYYNDMGHWKIIPQEWKDKDIGLLAFDLQQGSDFGFLPKREDHTGQATLCTGNRELKITYQTDSEENAFQLYHPKDASFVCIEPVTAKNPRAAQTKKHHLQVHIQSFFNVGRSTS